MPQFWKIFNWTLLVGTLIGILQPAFLENKSVTQIIVSLFEPEASQGFLMRWLLLLVFIAALYVLIIDAVYRKQPLSVVRTILEVRFLNADCSVAETHREQLLRANRPGITAYFSKHFPDFGTIVGDSIDASLFSAHHAIKSNVDKYGSDKSGYEIFQMFDVSLPYGWYMPLIPVRLINKKYEDMPRFIQKYLTLRRHSVTFRDEFNVEKPSIGFQATNYSQFNVRVILKFVNEIPKGVKFRHIQDIGVTDLRFDLRHEDRSVQVYLEKLRKGEALKITWFNDPLASEPRLAGV